MLSQVTNWFIILAFIWIWLFRVVLNVVFRKSKYQFIQHFMKKQNKKKRINLMEVYWYCLTVQIICGATVKAIVLIKALCES